MHIHHSSAMADASDTIRLVYTASIGTVRHNLLTDPVFANLLTSIDSGNRRDKMGALLFYSNGYLMISLEGARDAVRSACLRLTMERYLREPMILLQQRVRGDRLVHQPLRVVAENQAIRHFLADMGVAPFNPFLLSEPRILPLLEFLSRQPDATTRNTRRRNSDKDSGVLDWFWRLFSSVRRHPGQI